MSWECSVKGRRSGAGRRRGFIQPKSGPTGVAQLLQGLHIFLKNQFGLRESLDQQNGGEIAANLDRLYEYMVARLVEANIGNDVALIDEVAGLLRNVKSGWDAISH